MSDLSLTNIINVTVTGTPTGLGEINVNSLALFTTETPGNLDVFRTYVSAQAVATDYGTNSVTAQMANAIFAQSPNILSGNGRLVIIPLKNTSVSATSGDFTTADISSNVSNIEAVSDGDLRVTLNGTNIDLTGLDFTGADTLAKIAQVLQGVLTNAVVTATSTTIKIESKKVGDDSDVVVAQLPGGSGTNLSVASLFNTGSGSATSGVDATGETIAQAITRTEEDVSYVGVITNLEMEDDVITGLATTIQAKDMIFLHHSASTEDIAGLATTIENASNDKTRILGYFQTKATANLMKSAYAGRAFSVNFNGVNTSQTLNLKSLATITADDNVNQTIYDQVGDVGMDLYVSYRGVASVFSTGGNNFFDQVYSRLAFQFALETAGFNFLRQTNTKVPQTEPGMDGLKGSLAQICERFVTNGYLGVGLTWNSSETFGNPEDLRRNIIEKGYYIFSLPISQQAQSERESRVAPLIQIAAKEAGAIHRVVVNVVVNP